MKYQKQKGTAHPLKYLLLFGDGSYENKTPPPGNPNFIPTYQSQNSNVVVSSFTSDDFYGFLRMVKEKQKELKILALADSLFPIHTGRNSNFQDQKISRSCKYGDWKNVICLTADDEDGNTHMSDAEGLASLLNDSVPDYNIEKIYLDAYQTDYIGKRTVISRCE